MPGILLTHPRKTISLAAQVKLSSWEFEDGSAILEILGLYSVVDTC